jgi:hypothetical protein
MLLFKYPLQRINVMMFMCSILDHRDRQQFTCRIIHSLPLEMSAVQIFYHDKMVTVSHLIGNEQLPSKTQVGQAATDMLPTLDQSVRERAFLIKDAAGDWGVVTAYWTGVRAGVRGTKGESLLSAYCLTVSTDFTFYIVHMCVCNSCSRPIRFETSSRSSWLPRGTAVSATCKGR